MYICDLGNIWTHMIGVVFLFGCLYLGITGIPNQAFFVDYLMMTVFLISAIKCLLCSTIFHTLAAHHHPEVYDKAAILDYSGISLLIFGSFMMVIYYGLYCYAMLKWIYIALLAFMCASGVILPWFEFFRCHSFRVNRTIFYVSLGLAAGAIAIHTIYLNGWNKMTSMATMEYFILEVILYLLGAFVYAARIPEIWFPGKVDHWFHSHQFWHVMVVAAVYCHYIGSVAIMHSRLTNETCPR